jgi:hypothetical protein
MSNVRCCRKRKCGGLPYRDQSSDRRAWAGRPGGHADNLLRRGCTSKPNARPGGAFPRKRENRLKIGSKSVRTMESKAAAAGEPMRSETPAAAPGRRQWLKRTTARRFYAGRGGGFRAAGRRWPEEMRDGGPRRPSSVGKRSPDFKYRPANDEQSSGLIGRLRQIGSKSVGFFGAKIKRGASVRFSILRPSGDVTRTLPAPIRQRSCGSFRPNPCNRAEPVLGMRLASTTRESPAWGERGFLMEKRWGPRASMSRSTDADKGSTDDGAGSSPRSNALGRHEEAANWGGP